MNRREFLSMLSMGVGSLFLRLQIYKSAPARLLKPSGGKILTFNEGGRTWDVSINLGPQYEVMEIYQDRDYFYARVRFQNHNILLKSPDGLRWYTNDWSPHSAWQYHSLKENHG